MKTTRRRFLETSAAAATVAAAAGAGNAASARQTYPAPPTTRRGDMLYRMLGTTGEQVSLIGLGGHHIGRQKEEAESLKIIRSAIDRGITFMDNCWDYHDGGSELRMGKALQNGYREKVFLMTKIDGRDKATAAKQIEECLVRLRTDRIDLLQHHEIIRVDDPDLVFADGGAWEAVRDAQKAGKVRFMGFTGHKDPFVHQRMLQVAASKGMRFDAVQLPLNVMDAHFRSFEQGVLPLLVKDKIGVLGMKAMGDPFILQSKTVNAIECLHYVMNLPTSVVITGIDSMKILDQAIEAARTFQPQTPAQVAALLARTRTAALTGKYEKFKVSTHFDGTIKNPDWLGKPAGGA